jgi:hypothetical protein
MVVGKIRVVYIDACFDEYFEKLRAGLQSNFLSPPPGRIACKEK